MTEPTLPPVRGDLTFIELTRHRDRRFVRARCRCGTLLRIPRGDWISGERCPRKCQACARAALKRRGTPRFHATEPTRGLGRMQKSFGA